MIHDKNSVRWIWFSGKSKRCLNYNGFWFSSTRKIKIGTKITSLMVCRSAGVAVVRHQEEHLLKLSEPLAISDTNEAVAVYLFDIVTTTTTTSWPTPITRLINNHKFINSLEIQQNWPGNSHFNIVISSPFLDVLQSTQSNPLTSSFSNEYSHLIRFFLFKFIKKSIYSTCAWNVVPLLWIIILWIKVYVVLVSTICTVLIDALSCVEMFHSFRFWCFFI